MLPVTEDLFDQRGVVEQLPANRNVYLCGPAATSLIKCDDLVSEEGTCGRPVELSSGCLKSVPLPSQLGQSGPRPESAAGRGGGQLLMADGCVATPSRLCSSA